MPDPSVSRSETSSQPTDMRRELRLELMADAGKKLAVRWGHQPWSDSWARLVAETLLSAAEKAEDILDWRCECGDLNSRGEAFCHRCGAGQPEDEDA